MHRPRLLHAALAAALTAGVVPAVVLAAPAQAAPADTTPPVINVYATATATGVNVMYTFGTPAHPDTDVTQPPVVRGAYGTDPVPLPVAGFAIPVRVPGAASVGGLTPGAAVTVTVFAHDTSNNRAVKSVTIRGSTTSVDVSDAAITYGQAIDLTAQTYGILTAPQALPNQMVFFERRTPGTGAWLPIQLSVSDASGRAIAPGFSPESATEVRTRVVGNDRFTSTVSAPRRISVQATVSLAASKKIVKRSKAVKLSGKVAQPSRARGTVRLQQWARGAWRTVDTRTVSEKNAFTFTVKQKSKGTFKYRALKTADAGRGGAASAVSTVRVK